MKLEDSPFSHSLLPRKFVEIMNLPSRVLDQAVAALSRLPGIGRKTALRLALHLLKTESADVQTLAAALGALSEDITYCKQCHNLSDDAICSICSNPRRQQGTVCVVEDLRDVIAIENTNQFNGVYHVLGGLISPMDGIGPEKLKIGELVQRVESGLVTEIIMALSATMEGDTTIFYISKRLRELPVNISTISRGIAFGGELEYADEITLGKSILSRVPYKP